MAAPNDAYKLSAFNGKICATGSARVRYILYRMNSAESKCIYHEDGSIDFRYVEFDATRETFMAAEAVATPVYIDEEYIKLRQYVMLLPYSLASQWEQVKPQMRRPLMSHQTEYCALAYPKAGMFNGSEQGTGKTATAIALAHAWRSKFTIVVSPKSIMEHWFMEWHEVLADSELERSVIIPLMYSDSSSMPVSQRLDILGGLLLGAAGDKQVVIITNYEALQNITEFILDPANMIDIVNLDLFVVFDEAWKLKSPKAKVTKAAMAISNIAEHVMCSTGTPVGQGVTDLWSQLSIVQKGVDMEPHKDWDANYIEYAWVTANGRAAKKAIGCKDPIGLMRRIAPFFYRASKASCLDLPPKLPVRRIVLEFSPEVMKIYKDVERDGEAALGDGLSLMGMRRTLLLLQQICGGFVFNPDGVYEEEEAGQPHDLRLRLLHSPKMAWLIDYAQDELIGEPTTRVLIWCKFNSEVMHIQIELEKILGEGRVVACHGKMKENLEEVRESYNSRDPDGVQVLVCQYKKMAYGHNLQATDHSINYSHTWSHVEKSQSGDRGHRLGRIGSIAFTELVIKDTVDLRVLHATDRLQDMHERYSPDTTSLAELMIGG